MTDIEFKPGVSLLQAIEYANEEENKLPSHLLREGEVYNAWGRLFGPYENTRAIKSLAVLERLINHPPTRRHPIGRTTMKLIFVTDEDYIRTRYARSAEVSEDGTWSIRQPIEMSFDLPDGLISTKEGFFTPTPLETDYISKELH